MRKSVFGFVALSLSLGVSAASGRDLTFDQRVTAQNAIERVYYAHQIGSTRPFEEAAPRAAIERKVTTYLEQTAALQDVWQTPVTDDMLKRELRRMTENSRSPERLRELFGALQNDPFLIQECLVRPTLVDRLARNAFGSDEAIHAAAREEAEQLRRGLLRSGVERFADDPRLSVVEIARTGHAEVPGSNQDTGAVRRIELSPEAFARWRGMAPGRAGEIGAVRSERDAFAITVVLEERPGWARLATFNVAKRRWEDWRNGSEASLDGRSVRAVADAGISLEVPTFEARGRSRSNAAAPSMFPVGPDDIWDDGSLDGLPYPRANQVEVWTGSLMVVWGGYNGALRNTGGRYDPATDSWTAMSTTNAPRAAEHATATWTGSVVAVRAGDLAGSANAGGRYDPTTDTWLASGRILETVATDVSGRPATGAGADSELISVRDGVVPLEPPAPKTDQSPFLGYGSGNQEFPYVTETPNGFVFPTSTPVASEFFLGTQGGDFGYCVSGPSAGLACAIDAECPQSTCELIFDNTFCLSYNMNCKGVRSNQREYGFNDVFEATYDSSPAPGRQTWIERNWNYVAADSTYWRPFAFNLDVDANSTCVGGTNAGAYCKLLDAAGICTGGGTCTGRAPTGQAMWTFTPNNRDGNSSLILRWPWATINAREGTDNYFTNGFSTWMRSSDFNPGTTSSGASFTTYLDHTNDRRGPWLNGLYAMIDFNTTSVDGKVGATNAGFFNARISGSTPSRVIGSMTGVRSEVNLASTGSPQQVGQSYGVLVQFNPTGANITETSHTGILINTPSVPGAGTRISTQNGLWITDQQLVRSGGGGSAILVASQSTSDATEGNIRMDGANWNNGHFQLASGHLWRDATRGVLRYKNASGPGSESDGNAVVTGTASNSHGVVFWGVSTAADPNFDTGDEVCAASGTGLTCVDTSDLNSSLSVACSQAHTAPRWLAFCK